MLRVKDMNLQCGCGLMKPDEDPSIEDIISFVSEPLIAPLEKLVFIFIPVVPLINNRFALQVTLLFDENSFANKRKSEFLNEMAHKLHDEEIKKVKTFKQYTRYELERIAHESSLSRLLIGSIYNNFPIIAKGFPIEQNQQTENKKKRKNKPKSRKTKEKKPKIS